MTPGSRLHGIISRRRLLEGALASASAATAPATAMAMAQPSGLRVERFPIWPATPPGYPSAGVEDTFVKRKPNGEADDIAWPHVAKPMLTVIRPEEANGAAILIVPGGGYARVAVGRLGSGMARRFAARGITAFELLYRLPHDGWAAGPDAPLQDAQRAMRIIRAGAGTRWQVDPQRIAVAGFSAGGHLAARTAARPDLATYQPVDAADGSSARPDLAALFYPVVTLSGAEVHKQSREHLLGRRALDPEAQRMWSAHVDLPPDMPPTFVSCNADDPVVPAGNSILMYSALRAARIPAELMIFEKGGHGPPAPRKGWSGRQDGAPSWFDLFMAFAGDHVWPFG